MIIYLMTNLYRNNSTAIENVMTFT